MDFAIDKIDAINQFLRQGTYENVPFNQTVQQLIQLFPK
ncbi:MAG: hypothetical protein AAB066_02890 [Candidatus Margulisiibacteriota bacterium]